MTFQRKRGIVLIEVLAYVGLLTFVFGSLLLGVTRIGRTLAAGARQEARMEEWVRMSQEIRDDIRAASRIEVLSTPPISAGNGQVQAGPAMRIRTKSGAVVEYWNVEDWPEKRKQPPISATASPAPAAKKSGKGRIIQITTTPLPPLTAKDVPPLSIVHRQTFVRKYTSSYAENVQRVEGLIFTGVSRSSQELGAGIWDLSAIKAGTLIETRESPLYVSLDFELADRDTGCRKMFVAAATREESPAETKP